MLKAIDGRKTFIIAFLTLLYAILGFILKLHDAQRTLDLILLALGMITFRSAMKKMEVK